MSPCPEEAQTIHSIIFAYGVGDRVLQPYSLAEFVPAWRDATVWRLLVRTGADLQTFKACVMPVAGALPYSKLVKSVQELLSASGLADMQRRQLRARQRRAG